MFQITLSQTNSKVRTIFEYIRHYGLVILLLCITTLQTGLFEANFAQYTFSLLQKQCFFLLSRIYVTGRNWSKPYQNHML